MAFCKNCQEEIADNQAFCPHCGAPQSGNYVQKNQYAYGGGSAYVADSGSIGWGVLSCFIPLVGLILFLVWHDEKPRSAKVAGIGALIGVGVSFLLGVLGGMASAFLSLL